MFGIQETNKVCLYAGVLAIPDTIVLWVITFPKCTGGSPHVLLALLLGAGNCTGNIGGLDAAVKSVGD